MPHPPERRGSIVPPPPGMQAWANVALISHLQFAGAAQPHFRAWTVLLARPDATSLVDVQSLSRVKERGDLVPTPCKLQRYNTDLVLRGLTWSVKWCNTSRNCFLEISALYRISSTVFFPSKYL
jgi:hypothetical protein